MLCYRIFIFLQLLSPLIVVIFLCPGANAVQNEQPFPDITFKVFNTFIEENFSSKISLATVLMLLFTINENTDLLNLHQRQQNPQLKGVEKRMELGAWIKSLAREIQLQTTDAKFKTFFKQSDGLKSLPDTEVITKLGTKLNNFANMLGLKAYGSDNKLIKKLRPISKTDIQPIIIICPPSFSCSDKKCKGRSILQSTDNTDVPHVTLIKGSEIFKNVAVLSGHCTNCETHYFPDHENYKDNSGFRKRIYLHTANYLKIGQNLYVDQIFSNAVMNGIYSFHASTAAYAEYWTNSYGKQSSFKIQRRQMWHAFIQESIRTLSQASNIFFEVADNSSIQDLTRGAFAILGEHGGIRIADKHACSECTQEYKSVADWLPVVNDAAAVLGVDENRAVPPLINDDPRGETRNSPGPTEDDTMDVDVDGEKKVVKMVVMDGIVMGPTCCAFDGCERALVNARGQGESFCIAHTAEFQNRCHVRDCQNNKFGDTQACERHRNEWYRYTQSRTTSSLAGVRRMLNRPSENLEWNGQRLINEQPHDEEAPEPRQKNYFSPSCYYCVETICAPCGVVIAWMKFATSESETNILDFLTKTYPNEATRPDYVCIDKACKVLKTSIQNGSWESWSKTTRLVVDAYHYVNHRVVDWLCRVYCNPAPLDGSAPNLVIEAETKDGKKYLKRAFNTQACEQLNSWIGGFESILKRMTINNFNWFLHVMLFYHTRHVLDKIKEKEEKEKKNQVNNDDDDDDDDDM
jgi:hypothetical protein